MTIFKKIDWFYVLSLPVVMLVFTALHYANQFLYQTYEDALIGSMVFWLGLILMRLGIQYYPTWRWLKLFSLLLEPLWIIDMLYGCIWLFGSSNHENTLNFNTFFDGLLLSTLYILRSAPILSIVALIVVCFKQKVPDSMVVILNGNVYHPEEQYRVLWFLKRKATFFSTTQQVYSTLELIYLKHCGINGTIVFDISPSVRELEGKDLIKLAEKQFTAIIGKLFSTEPFDTAIRNLSLSQYNEWRIMPGVYAKIACTKLKIVTPN